MRKQQGYSYQSPCGKLVIDSVIVGLLQTTYWNAQITHVDQLHPRAQTLVHANLDSATARYNAALKNLLLLEQNNLVKAGRRSSQSRTRVADEQPPEAQHGATPVSSQGYASQVATPKRKGQKKTNTGLLDASVLMASPIRLRKPTLPESDSL